VNILGVANWGGHMPGIGQPHNVLLYHDLHH